METQCFSACVALCAIVLVAQSCNGESMVFTSVDSDSLTKRELGKITQSSQVDIGDEKKLQLVNDRVRNTVQGKKSDSDNFAPGIIENRVVETTLGSAAAVRKLQTETRDTTQMEKLESLARNNTVSNSNNPSRIFSNNSYYYKKEEITTVNAEKDKMGVEPKPETDNLTHNPESVSEITDTIAFGKSRFQKVSILNNSTDIDGSINNIQIESLVSKNDNTKEGSTASNVGVIPSCNKKLSVAVEKFVLLENGSLLALDNDSRMIYPPGYFWKELNENNVIEIRGCVCLLKSCIRKCCADGMTSLPQKFTEDGEIIIDEKSSCAPSNNSLLHPFMPTFTDEETNETVNNSDIFILYGNPCKYGSYRLEPYEYPDDNFTLYQNGYLVVPSLNSNLTVDGYCLDAFDEDNVNEILPLICHNVEEDKEHQIKMHEIYVLYPIGMIISIPFLMATFFVYAAIPELNNLHGKSLMCQVSSLCNAYIFLSIIQLGGNALGNGFCISCAFIIFFSFHANFFWLNVMCFDIWWTFSGLRPLRGSVKEREFKKFVMYSCYAWGSPFIMLLVCIAMDFAPGIPDSYIKPMFGVKKCWFKGDDAALAYFFGPIGVLILCNLILFIATAFKIVSLKKETRMLKGQESKRHDQDAANQQRFNLYLKLFIVMGVNWIMEVISFAAGGPNYLWYITDLGNTLQGLLIFVIFVCKSKIRRLLAKRFCRKSSTYSSSTRSHPTPSRTSSYNYTQRTSVTSHDHMPMKSVGTYRNTDVP